LIPPLSQGGHVFIFFKGNMNVKKKMVFDVQNKLTTILQHSVTHGGFAAPLQGNCNDAPPSHPSYRKNNRYAVN
jgi:hypothetical protein